MRLKQREELELEKQVCVRARECGYEHRKLAWIGRRGAPDQFFGRDGDCVLIEFKKPGEVPTLQQMRQHDTLRRVFGLRVKWTDNYAEACNILEIPE